MPASEVKSFSIWLPDAKVLLNRSSGSLAGLEALEQAIIEKLEGCERLLRWAIIRVENDRALCDGAYLSI